MGISIGGDENAARRMLCRWCEAVLGSPSGSSSKMAPSALPGAQKQGVLGLKLSRDAPHAVEEVDDLTDEKGVVQGSPGYANAPLHRGDILLSIDGRDTGHMTPADVHSLLKGDLHTTVQLILGRGKDRVHVKVMRHRFHEFDAQSSSLDVTAGDVTTSSRKTDDIDVQFRYLELNSLTESRAETYQGLAAKTQDLDAQVVAAAEALVVLRQGMLTKLSTLEVCIDVRSSVFALVHERGYGHACLGLSRWSMIQTCAVSFSFCDPYCSQALGRCSANVLRQ